MRTLIPFTGSQVDHTFAGVKPRGDILAVFIIYLEMQVRKCTVAGIAAVADELPLFYPIAYGHQGAIFLQVPVHGLAAIVVRDDDVIAFRQVRIAQSALVAVFFYRGNNTAAGSAYPASLFHFKIKADLSLVTEAAVVGLDKQVLTAFRERKRVDMRSDRRAKVTSARRGEWLGMDLNSTGQAWSCRHNLQLQKSLEKLVDRSGRK